jgi:hypothetical protein
MDNKEPTTYIDGYDAYGCDAYGCDAYGCDAYGYAAEWIGTNGLTPILPKDPTLFEENYPVMFEWNSETFESDDFDLMIKKVIDQTVSAKVQYYCTNELLETVEKLDVPYELKSLSITSRVLENEDAPWIYPDQFDVEEHPNHPKQYGGVVFFTEENLPKHKLAGEYSTCGTDTGPNNDGFVYYKNDEGEDVPVETGYYYTDLFYQCDFSFIPMNSGKDESEYKGTVGANTRNRFRRWPFYPDVKDEEGLAAPIYPMDTVISFFPDDRPFITVEHTVKLETLPPVENNIITIKQIVFQIELDYLQKLRELQGLCNWNNPGEWDEDDEMSQEYPIQYPYTIVQDEEPTKRQTYNVPEGSLQKGDLWYNPTTKERKFYYYEDEATSVELLDGGMRYKSKESVEVIFDDESKDVKRGIRNPSPKGLYLDIEAYTETLPEKNIKKGQIKSVTINKDGDNQIPEHWRNNDTGFITGGNGQAQVRIKVRRNKEWVDSFVPTHHGELNISKENDYNYG